MKGREETDEYTRISKKRHLHLFPGSSSRSILQDSNSVCRTELWTAVSSALNKTNKQTI